MPMAEDLNLLFVTLDQLRADVLFGRLRGFAPTPAIDRLRAEGVSFTQCFTAAVPCGPARASLLTGLHAFTHRGIRNGTPVARHHATLATELRGLGREPLLFGYCDMAADPTERVPRDPDLATYELPAAGFREIVEMRFEAPMAWIGHLRARGYDVPAPQPARWFDLYRPAGAGLRAPAFYRAEDSDTAFLADRTLEALDARRDRAWTAHVTFIRPHPPLVAPEPFNRLVDAAALPAPAAPPEGDHPFRRAWFSEPAQRGLFWGFDGRCAALAAGQVAELRAVYLGLVAELDRHLGRLLDWLDATGQAGRTVVVLLADHGEMLGDQGYWGKDNVLAPAHHVPLIVRAPGCAAGRTVDAVVSTLDVTPTILRLMGGAVPPAMDGGSLEGFLAGGGSAARGMALTEIDLAEPGAPTRFQTALGLGELSANAAILRDRQFTLVHFNGGLPPMLFDRLADPDERHDLAGEAAAVGEIARLRAAMLDLRMTRADRRLTHLSQGG